MLTEATALGFRTTERGFAGRVLLAGMAAIALLTAASSYQINYGANQDITEWSVCKNVANSHASGKAIFVPTNTSTEWSTFYTNAPPGVTIANCGCAVTAGSQTYSTAGSYSFNVPCYNNLTVEVWGAGGGGAGVASGNGGAGGASTWDGGVLTANGGAGATSNPGAGGTASGGTTNTTGGAGGNGASGKSGAGGAGANGGAGGTAKSSNNNGNAGSAPGGGGSGAIFVNPMGGSYLGDGGGGGGYSAKTYGAGTYAVGNSVAVAVGAAGTKGNGASYDGGAGAVGRVTITWN